MTLPEPITTFALTLPSPADHAGDGQRARYRITPSDEITYAATGLRLLPEAMEYDVKAGESRVVDLPHPLQPGMIDPNGADILDWHYVVTMAVLAAGRWTDRPGRRIVQPAAGVTAVDVALIPDQEPARRSETVTPVDRALMARDDAERAAEGARDYANDADLSATRAEEAAHSVVLPTSEAVARAVKDPGPAKDELTRTSAKAIGEAVPGSVLSPMSIFRAWAQKRDTQPVVCVFAGMSIVQGTDAGGEQYRFTTILSKAMQSAYALSSGEDSPAIRTLAQAVTTPPSQPGVQAINAGIGGTTAENFLTPTTRAQVAALNPRMLFIDVGVNEWHAGTPAATFKTNLKANIDALRSLITSPCTYVLVHGTPRLSSTSTVPWADYRNAKREIADEHPADTLFVDIEPAFASVGIKLGGTDPLDLFSDTVHPNGPGHAFLADLLRTALGIPAASAAIAPTPAVILASDDFGGGAASDVNARVMNNALGGTQTRTWSSPAPTAVDVKSGGTIGRGAGAVTFFAGVPEGTIDDIVKFTLSTVPVGSALSLDFRRASDSASGTVDAMRLNIGSAGSGAALSLISRVGGTSTTLATWGSVAAGDVLEIRPSGGTVSVYKNGTFLGSASIPSGLAAPGWVGFAGTGSLTSWGVTDTTVVQA